MRIFNVILLVVSCILGCSSKQNTLLNSVDYDNKEGRIAILKAEIVSFSDFEDAEFKLFNVNGFSNLRATVPGASSWDYQFAVKVNPSEVEKWTEGMLKSEFNKQENLWMAEIVKKRKNSWHTATQLECFVREKSDVVVVTYREEGIVFKRIITK